MNRDECFDIQCAEAVSAALGLQAKQVESFDLRKTAQIAGHHAVVEPHGGGRDHQIRIADRRARGRELGVEARVHARDIEIEGNHWDRGEHLLDETLGPRAGDRARESVPPCSSSEAEMAAMATGSPSSDKLDKSA